MAKKDTILVRMKSTVSGYFKVKKRNPKKQPEKLTRTMYDPNVRKHVAFKEEKLK